MIIGFLGNNWGDDEDDAGAGEATDPQKCRTTIRIVDDNGDLRPNARLEILLVGESQLANGSYVLRRPTYRVRQDAGEFVADLYRSSEFAAAGIEFRFTGQIPSVSSSVQQAIPDATSTTVTITISD